ncbi:MAG TPA: trehalose-phosphatase [Bryobacteraceae bacterium]|nr:trehalose-phosphatase [Bryobacteraceae bacterium]
MTALTRPVLECWPDVASRLRDAPRIALFLDFDGTLADLRPRPDQVSVDDRTRLALTALAGSPRFRIWIISGRRQADLRDRVGLPGIRYLGLYGWEARGDKELSEETRRALECLSAWMGALLARKQGVWIEEKQHTLAVHHRGAPKEEAALAGHIVNFVVRPFSDLFRIAPGKSVWEIMPWEMGDKGSAVRRELAALPPDTVPVYLGDDLSDEAAFAALPGGITVHIGGGRSSCAQYYLGGVSEVRTFLCKLEKEFG